MRAHVGEYVGKEKSGLKPVRIITLLEAPSRPAELYNSYEGDLPQPTG